jgi:site-specific recombinase XerD
MVAATSGRSKAQPQVAPLVADLGRSWRLSLEAQNKSVRTIEQYIESLRLFVRFLDGHGMPQAITSITREHVETFIADILTRAKPSTAATRYKCLRLFFAWCEDEGEIPRSPMEKMKPPIVPDEPVDVLTDIELVQLLKVCKGTDFEDRRDLAVICLLADTGIRRSELAGLSVDDVDLDVKYVRVLGKGRRPRVVPFGAKSAQAIDRYLRVRGSHALAALPDLWLGTAGRRFGDQAVRQMLERRGAEASVANLHAHRFRHTFAHQHLADGGNEGDLMMLAGWRSRQMLSRYASSTAAERARTAYKSPLDRL